MQSIIETLAGARPGLVRAAALLLPLAAAGCSGMSMDRVLNPWGGVKEQSRVPADAVAYACDGGKSLYVRYGPSAQYAMLLYPDREFRLDAEGGGPAPSKFSNGRTSLLAKDGVVSVEEGGTVTYAGCKKAEAKTK